jgi:hypothetical protein
MNDAIADIKARIRDSEGIPPNVQNLYLDGKLMKVCFILENSSVIPDAITAVTTVTSVTTITTGPSVTTCHVVGSKGCVVL